MKKDEQNLRNTPDDGGSGRLEDWRCIIDSIQEIFESYASLDDPMVEPDDYFGLTIDALKDTVFDDKNLDDTDLSSVEQEEDLGVAILVSEAKPEGNPIIESTRQEEDLEPCLPSPCTPPPDMSIGYKEPTGLASTNSSNVQIKTPDGKKSTVNDTKPKRPLSAYNLFFQLERERLIAGVDPETPFTAADVERVAINRRLMEQGDRPKRKHRKSHGKISFAELARKIANKWKTLNPDAKDLLQERAAIEKARYLRELETWTTNNNETQRAEFVKKLAADNAELAVSPSPSQHPDMDGSFHMVTPDQYRHHAMNRSNHQAHNVGWQNPPMMPSQRPNVQPHQGYGNYHGATIITPGSSFDSCDYNRQSSPLEYEAWAMAERTGWNPNAVMHMMHELDSRQGQHKLYHHHHQQQQQQHHQQQQQHQPYFFPPSTSYSHGDPAEDSGSGAAVYHDRHQSPIPPEEPVVEW